MPVTGFPQSDPETGESRDPSDTGPRVFISPITRLLSRSDEPTMSEAIALIREAREFYRDCIHAEECVDANKVAASICYLIDSVSNRIDPSDGKANDDAETP
jgi:hypothetical protein